MGNVVIREDRHQHGFGLRVWRVSPDAMPAAHTHPDVEINFLLEGTVRYLYGGSIVDLEPERITVLWGGIPHQTLTPGTAGTGVWLTLPLTLMLRWRLPANLPSRLLAGQIVKAGPAPGDQLMLERWLDDFTSGDETRRRVMVLELEARLTRLALEGVPEGASASRTLAGGIRQVGRISDHLARHYQGPVTLESVGAALGLHPKHVARVFRQHSGMSVLDYVRRLRLAHAQRLLLTTGSSVAAIAMEAGFGSLGSFYRAFTLDASGLGPQQYRKLSGVSLRRDAVPSSSREAPVPDG